MAPQKEQHKGEGRKSTLRREEEGAQLGYPFKAEPDPTPGPGPQKAAA